MVDYLKALLYLWLTPSGSIKVKRSGSILLKKISERKGKQKERRITREKATGDNETMKERK